MLNVEEKKHEQLRLSKTTNSSDCGSVCGSQLHEPCLAAARVFVSAAANSMMLAKTWPMTRPRHAGAGRLSWRFDGLGASASIGAPSSSKQEIRAVIRVIHVDLEFSKPNWSRDRCGFQDRSKCFGVRTNECECFRGSLEPRSRLKRRTATETFQPMGIDWSISLLCRGPTGGLLFKYTPI